MRTCTPDPAQPPRVSSCPAMADGTLRLLPCLTTPVPTTTNGRSDPGPALVETRWSVLEGARGVDKFVVCQEGLFLSPAVMPDRVARGAIARSGIQISVRRRCCMFLCCLDIRNGARCASADVLVPRSARSLAALVWGDSSAVWSDLPSPLAPSFQTVCGKAAWPDLESRHQCAEGAAWPLVAMDCESGARCASADVLVPRSARSLAALVWGDGVRFGLICLPLLPRHSRRSAAPLHGQIWKPDISAPPALRFS